MRFVQLANRVLYMHEWLHCGHADPGKQAGYLPLVGIFGQGSRARSPHDMPIAHFHIAAQAAQVTNQSIAPGAFAFLHLRPRDPPSLATNHTPLCILKTSQRSHHASQSLRQRPKMEVRDCNGKGLGWRQRKICSSPRVRLGSFVPP